MERSSDYPRISVHVVVWLRDFFSLYDYYSDNYKSEKEFIVNNSCLIGRSESIAYCLAKGEWSMPGISFTPLVSLSYINSQILFLKSDSSSEDLWIPTRMTKETKVKLAEGTVFKLGCKVFEVLEINFPRTPYVPNTEEEILNEGLSCKICMNNAEVGDPLIQSCGRCKNARVHISCLRQWIAKDTVVKTRTSSTVYINNRYVCDVCKELLPLYVRFKHQIYYLFKVETPPESYMILKSVKLEYPGVKLYLLNIQKHKKFIIGSSRESDLKVKDFTVERFHAELRATSKGIFIRDKKSKYGTMIRQNSTIELQESLTVQVGPSLITVRRIPNRSRSKASLFSCLQSKGRGSYR